jgi:putative nucleotidyltransferase with HDIG domain
MNSDSWFERKGVIEKLRRLLAEHSCDGYLVGGYVRDQLLGRRTRDLDLAVGHEAVVLARQAANRLGGAFVLLDEERQTARVVLRDQDQLFYVDFAGLRGDSLERDLAARDFTINAMAINAHDTSPKPQLIDPHGGQQDLQRGVIRAVSDTAFSDDPLRLLRAVRLGAELEMQVESHTEELMVRDASLITLSSPERTRDELCRTLGTNRAVDGLRHLDQLGILPLLIPELVPLRGLEQPPPHHQDAFDHSLATVEELERIFTFLSLMVDRGQQSETEKGMREAQVWGYLTDALSPFAGQMLAHLKEQIVDERSRLVLLKMAGLLHDLGKPIATKMDEKERIRFFGHQVEGATLAARVLRRLRFGNREVRLVQTVIRHHMRPLQLAQEERVTRRAVYRFFRDTRGVGVDVLLHSLADNLALWRPGQELTEWVKLSETVGLLLRKYYEEYDQVIGPPALISGSDLTRHLGMEPGPAIGRLLQAVQEAQAAGEVATRDQALRLAETLLAEGES